MKRYFKVLDENGTTRNCGDVIVWSLPTYDKDKGWSPGKWMPPAEGELVLYGYKVGTLDQLIQWLGPRIFEAEIGPEFIDNKRKTFVRTCRLLREYTKLLGG